MSEPIKRAEAEIVRLLKDRGRARICIPRQDSDTDAIFDDLVQHTKKLEALLFTRAQANAVYMLLGKHFAADHAIMVKLAEMAAADNGHSR